MTSLRHSAVDRSWRRVDGIDVLRGLAIFFVLMNHVNIRLFLAKVPYTVGIPKQIVSSLVWNGQFGVQMFFAVSGFLITTTSLRRWGSLANISARDFYRMRFARIAPLLLLLLVVLSALHFADVSGFVVAAKTGGLGRALLAALTFHVNLLEARRGYLPGPWDILWSLSVEEMFYLFFPLACLLFARRRLLVPLLCVFVFLGPFRADLVYSWQRHLAGEVLSRRNGCDRARLPDGAAIFPHPILTEVAKDHRRRRHRRSSCSCCVFLAAPTRGDWEPSAWR